MIYCRCRRLPVTTMHKEQTEMRKSVWVGKENMMKKNQVR